ncbi:sensor histidine kinase [Paracidobacterium acidisoli]|uniref:histidine kinase n=1 Tax=Paracidobacterium acidisoli TaxID=2303751 RepID=A0A372ILB6_9BACT|nr:HAMP domain-containing sensor histidine kinase [Paracidobacterium acidisoli]MBT9332293.1 HAMP domain-containing histidine kinase [Paracidobacterium acidisoli]
MKRYSIVRRLIVTVLLTELLAALCVTGIALIYERHSHFRAFDVMLHGRADSLLGAVQDAEDTGDNVMLDGTEISLPREDVYEVRDASGRVLGRSANWSGASQTELQASDGSYFKMQVKDRHYRGLVLHGLRIVDPGDKGGGIPRHVVIVYGAPTKHVWRAVRDAVEFYALASVLLMAITGVLMAWLLSRALAPVRELAAEAAGISVHAWQFNPPEEVRRIRELAPLEQALRSVLERLERAFEQQRRFVSDAAHELKTAVAVTKSSLQLLHMKKRTAEEYEAGLERCHADCARMEEIVLKMLTLARVESAAAGTTAIETASDAAACTRRTAEQFASMAELRNVKVQVTASGPLSVRLSEDDFGLIVSNLLLNALQHSPQQAAVQITVEAAEGGVQLRVVDQGDGINTEALPHVFERFYRDDPSRNRNTGGTGLGLAICRAIVVKAGGTIRIESERGGGAAATVWLPGVGDGRG